MAALAVSLLVALVATVVLVLRATSRERTERLRRLQSAVEARASSLQSLEDAVQGYTAVVEQLDAKRSNAARGGGDSEGSDRLAAGKMHVKRHAGRSGWFAGNAVSGRFASPGANSVKSYGLAVRKRTPVAAAGKNMAAPVRPKPLFHGFADTFEVARTMKAFHPHHETVGGCIVCAVDATTQVSASPDEGDLTNLTVFWLVMLEGKRFAADPTEQSPSPASARNDLWGSERLAGC